MTKKDYVTLANALKGLPRTVTIEDVIAAVADVLAADNGRFDRDRFIAAATAKGAAR